MNWTPVATLLVLLAGLSGADASRRWPGVKKSIFSAVLYCEAGPCLICGAEDAGRPCRETGHRQVLECTRQPQKGKTYQETLSMPLPEGHLVTRSASSAVHLMEVTLSRSCTPTAASSQNLGQQATAGSQATVSAVAAQGGQLAAATVDGTEPLQDAAGDEQSTAEGEGQQARTAADPNQRVRKMRETLDQEQDAADGEDNLDNPLADREVWITEQPEIVEAVGRQVAQHSRREDGEDSVGRQPEVEEEVIHSKPHLTRTHHTSSVDSHHWSLFHFELGMLAILTVSLPVVYWRKRTIRHL